jgi:hypothetical protein
MKSTETIPHTECEWCHSVQSDKDMHPVRKGEDLMCDNCYNTINKEEETVMSNKFNPNNCHAINVSGKRKGLQCGNPKGNLEIGEGHYLCNNHLKMWTKNIDSLIFISTMTQEQLIKVLEPAASIPKGVRPAAKLAAQFGMKTAKEALAEGGAITRAYINKETEDDEMDVIKEMKANLYVMEEELKAMEQDPERINEAAELFSDMAELDREIRWEESHEAATMPTDVHGDKGQVDERYEEMVHNQLMDMQEEEESRYHIVGSGPRNLMTDKVLMRKVHDLLVEQFTKAKRVHGDKLVAVSGGAKGYDFVFARAALEAGVRLHVYIPSPTYVEYYWKGAQARSWIDAVLAQAEEVKIICEHHQGGKANFVRNDAMVEVGDQYWVYDIKTRGTTQFIKKAAQKEGTRIWRVNATLKA